MNAPGPLLEAARRRLERSALARTRKVYERDRGETVRALDGVSLRLRGGAFVAVMGPSGSGKSTLLHCSGGLTEVTSGEVFVEGTPMAVGSEAARTRFRRERIGIVFQHLNLLPSLSVLQNVMLPSRLAHRSVGVDTASDYLARVGMKDRMHDLPAELSGGQQQRAAIARALATDRKMDVPDVCGWGARQRSGGARDRCAVGWAVSQAASVRVTWWPRAWSWWTKDRVLRCVLMVVV